MMLYKAIFVEELGCLLENIHASALAFKICRSQKSPSHASGEEHNDHEYIDAITEPIL